MATGIQTVREIVQTQASSTRVFERFGIEYCCGGGERLIEACASTGVDVDAVIAALEAVPHNENLQAKDWTKEPLAKLTEHIVRAHHVYCKRELPHLLGLAAKVVNAHGGRNPELAVIQSKLTQLADKLIDHLAEEEYVVFPIIEELERKEAREGVGRDNSPISISSPLAQLIEEHENAGVLLAQIRSLSRDFVTPEYACTTYNEFFDELREFERDLHRHVHLENNILFPRAIELESSNP